MNEETLLREFWDAHEPRTSASRQYRSVIGAKDEAQAAARLNAWAADWLTPQARRRDLPRVGIDLTALGAVGAGGRSRL